MANVTNVCIDQFCFNPYVFACDSIIERSKVNVMQKLQTIKQFVLIMPFKGLPTKYFLSVNLIKYNVTTFTAALH